jgi:hypothetical protein
MILYHQSLLGLVDIAPPSLPLSRLLTGRTRLSQGHRKSLVAIRLEDNFAFRFASSLMIKPSLSSIGRLGLGVSQVKVSARYEESMVDPTGRVFQDPPLIRAA